MKAALFSLAKKILRVTTSNQCLAFTSSQFKPPEIQYLAEEEDMEVELKIPSSPAGPFALREHTYLILISREGLCSFWKVVWQLSVTLSGC